MERPKELCDQMISRCIIYGDPFYTASQRNQTRNDKFCFSHFCI